MPQEPMANNPVEAQPAPPHNDPQEGDLKWLGMPGQPNQAQQIFVVYWEACGPGVLYVKSGDAIALWKTHGTVIDQSFRSPGLDPPNQDDYLTSVGCEIPLCGEPGEVNVRLPWAGDVLMCRDYKATNKLVNNKAYRNLQMQQIQSPCVLFRQPEGGATDQTDPNDLVAWNMNRGEETEVSAQQRESALRLLRWSAFRMRQEGCCLNVTPTPIANLPVVTDPDRLSSDVICEVVTGVHQVGEPGQSFNQIIVQDPTIDEPIPVCLVGQIWDKTVKLLEDSIEPGGWIRIRNCNVNMHGGKHSRASQITPVHEWCKSVVDITGNDADVQAQEGQGVVVPQNADGNQNIVNQNQEEDLEEDPLDIAARILGDVEESDGFVNEEEEVEQEAEVEESDDEDGMKRFIEEMGGFYDDETQNVFAQNNNASSSTIGPDNGNTQVVPQTNDFQETLPGNQRYGFQFRGNLQQVQNQNKDSNQDSAIQDELDDDRIEDDSDQEVVGKKRPARGKAKSKAKAKAKGKAKAGVGGARKKARND